MSDTVLDRFTIGAGKILPVDHTGPASYTTGGETLGNINNMTGISVVGLGSLDMVLGSGSLDGQRQLLRSRCSNWPRIAQDVQTALVCGWSDSGRD